MLQAQHATQIGVRARGGFPDAASAVGAGAEPGDRSGRSYVDLFALTIDGDPGEEDRAEVLHQAHPQGRHTRRCLLRVGP